MGADFLLAYMPAFKPTKKRIKELHKIVDSIPFDDDSDYNEIHGIELNYDKESYHNKIDEILDLQNRRDTGTIYIDNKPYIFTGGMSWGDEPTESFDVIESVYRILEATGNDNLFEKWLKEDWKKKK